MSNSTRQGGYDERLVVPLEASRRGAHRARVSPLLAALPLLAVMIVVAVVIGVAYTLFLRPGTQDGNDTASGPTATGPATQPAASGGAGGSTGTASKPAASTPASGGASSSAPAAGATVDKAATFTVFNGSSPAVNGLASEALKRLTAKAWTGGTVSRAGSPVKPPRTTVYYPAAADAATAKAIVKILGVGAAKLSPAIATSGIVVVVANDFAP